MISYHGRSFCRGVMELLYDTLTSADNDGATGKEPRLNSSATFDTTAPSHLLL